MTPTSRRIFAYWLLLLLPTVGVGLSAIYLLRREQARLEERASYADEARRAAVTARARLIAENVELLVGDVQTGLLEQLGNEPATGLDHLFDQLEQANPLVRAVFHCDATGQVVRPGTAASEEGRAFLRRFGPTLTGSPPWKPAPVPALVQELSAAGAPQAVAMKDQPQAAVTPPVLAQTDEQLQARQEISGNVSKVQRARRDTREIAYKNLISSYDGSPSASAPSAAMEADRLQDSRALESADESKSRLAKGVVHKDKLADLGATASAPLLAKKAETPVTPERHGWLPLKIDGRLHLLGWVQPAGLHDVRGVEVEMAALISRLGGVMPGEFASGEGYALRDDQGRVIEQAGVVPREWSVNVSNRENRLAEPSIRIPLADTLLPGWEVIAFSPLSGGSGPTRPGGGILVVGSLLVGIFLVAIVAGGWLLLRQARQSEAEAVQKTSFVANVSHEFKTPLTTIRLYAELLEQGRVKDAAQGGDYLRTIGRETERLARLVGNALDFSRLEQGRKKYDLVVLDLGSVLDKLVDMQRPRVEEAGLKLQLERPAGPLPVTTDRDACEQIVLNLLDNAVKYGGTGGEVTVQLAPVAAGGAEIRVLDRGPGVPAAHRERIFEKFHRVDDTLTAEQAGTGLGLSIARQLARGLGGELRYVPRDGGGAGFVFQLP